MTTVGWTNFALGRHLPGTGFSYFSWTPEAVISQVVRAWEQRKPGMGEQTLERKVVVPLENAIGFYCPPRIPLSVGLPLIAVAKQRQAGEDPYVEVSCSIDMAMGHGFKPTPAKSVEIVCYSAQALLEEDGKRDTNCDWEIVAVLCNDGEEKDTMEPLTMARNYLRMPGGTFSNYTAEEFAKAVYEHATKRDLRVVGSWNGAGNPYFI